MQANPTPRFTATASIPSIFFMIGKAAQDGPRIQRYFLMLAIEQDVSGLDAIPALDGPAGTVSGYNETSDSRTAP